MRYIRAATTRQHFWTHGVDARLLCDSLEAKLQQLQLRGHMVAAYGSEELEGQVRSETSR